MAGDYIRRDLAKKRFSKRLMWLKEDVHDEYSGALLDGCEADIELLDEIPAANVAEVVHGRWILHHTATGNTYTECSNCCTNLAFKTDKGTLAKLDMRGIPYCPFCSAKMDGGSNGE